MKREGLGRLALVSFGGASVAVALGIGARLWQRRPGMVPCKRLAYGAIGIAVLAAIIAAIAGLVGSFILTPWAFG
jgi:hypothetical protein